MKTSQALGALVGTAQECTLGQGRRKVRVKSERGSEETQRRERRTMHGTEKARTHTNPQKMRSEAKGLGGEGGEREKASCHSGRRSRSRRGVGAGDSHCGEERQHQHRRNSDIKAFNETMYGSAPGTVYLHPPIAVALRPRVGGGGAKGRGKATKKKKASNPME